MTTENQRITELEELVTALSDGDGKRALLARALKAERRLEVMSLESQALVANNTKIETLQHRLDKATKAFASAMAQKDDTILFVVRSQRDEVTRRFNEQAVVLRRLESQGVTLPSKWTARDLAGIQDYEFLKTRYADLSAQHDALLKRVADESANVQEWSVFVPTIECGRESASPVELHKQLSEAVEKNIALQRHLDDSREKECIGIRVDQSTESTELLNRKRNTQTLLIAAYVNALPSERAEPLAILLRQERAFFADEGQVLPTTAIKLALLLRCANEADATFIHAIGTLLRDQSEFFDSPILLDNALMQRVLRSILASDLCAGF